MVFSIGSLPSGSISVYNRKNKGSAKASMQSRSGHTELEVTDGSSAPVVCALQLLSDDSMQSTVF